MKILLLTEFFPVNKDLIFSGGVEVRTYYLTKYLNQEDQVSIICRQTKKPVNQVNKRIKIYPVGFRTTTIEANFSSIFGRLYFIFAGILKGMHLDFDLIEGSNFVTYLPAFLLGIFKRKPTIFWWPDVLGRDWFKYFGSVGCFGYLIEKISLSLPWTKIIALSESTKKKLIKAGVNKNKIKVIYGGVDLKNIKYQISNIKYRSKIKNITCISRLVKYKRVDDLIQAFSLLVNEYPDLKLTIVGRGPEELKLKRLVIEKKISNKVQFFKNLKREKIIELLAQSYLFCLPSVLEGFGLATLEAASFQIPYVVSDITVNKEITHNGLGGLIYQKENIIDLKNKLQLLLNNKKLYLQKQKQCLKLTKNYDWKIIAKLTRDVYKEVLNNFIKAELKA